MATTFLLTKVHKKAIFIEMELNSGFVKTISERANIMKYINRQIERKILSNFKKFRSILLVGARQVGKTRLLKEIFPNLKYVNLDNIHDEEMAKKDGIEFLNDNGVPLIIDEVQRAPELFRSIKYIIDKEDKKGLYIMSGSQLFKLMELASDSLAGRVNIIELSTLSLREIYNSNISEHFCPNDKYLKIIKQNRVSMFSDFDLWKLIQRGLYPEMQDKDIDFIDFYTSYVKTYIERDVRDIINVSNLNDFQRFMIAIAARTGEILNYASIASEIGKDEKTIKEWVSILETSGIIYLLQPYIKSELKRIIKKPKIYFRDTGLACFLTKWNTPSELMNGAMSGHMYETFVISEIIKSFINEGYDYRRYIYYYNGRDNTKGEQREIDLIIEENGIVYPVEIKSTTRPNADMISSYKVLESIKNIKIGKCAVVCNVENITTLSDNCVAIPLKMI